MLLGEFAALGTALAFTAGSVLFTLSGRMIGSPLINRTRLLLGLLIMMAVHYALTGALLPLQAGGSHWFWLGLSGFVGFTLGDAALFQAFVMIGPRLSMLVFALAPVLATVLAWIFLGEVLGAKDLLAIGITVGGIGWVVSDGGERQKAKAANGDSLDSRAYLIGLLCGLGGAVGQAVGAVMSKQGLANDFSPISGTVIRLLAGALSIWLFTLFRGTAVQGFRTLRANPRAFQLVTLATVAGPVVGVWLSLIAVQNAAVGIASTLMALTPVFLIPVGRIVFGERITHRAVVGTVFAFAGTALLFL